MPRNLEAEQSVLGAILLDEQCLDSVLDILSVEDFYHEGHRVVFEAMCRMVDRARPIDLVTLNEELARSGVLEKAGGMPYVAQLADGMPRTVNVEHYATIVRERGTLRALIRGSEQIIENCLASDEEPAEILDKAENIVFQISEGRQRSGFSELSGLVQEGLKKLEEAQQQGSGYGGLATGFERLDELTDGLQAGELIIVAARPSMGKTAMALNIAQHAALRLGKNVAIFSLEMSASQLAQRMLCTRARVDSQKVRRKLLRPEDWQKLAEAAGRLSSAGIFIDDSPGINVLEIRTKSRRLKMEKGLDLVIVDYLQLMQGVGRFENRNLEVSAISRSLKGLAKELDVPLIALSQLSRAPESRSNRRPQLSDLRESGSLEQDADVVAFIYREEQHNPTDENEGQAELILSKQRNGPTDNVELVFIKEYTCFENKSYRQDFMGPESPI
jgi:replicative DNA helicase